MSIYMPVWMSSRDNKTQESFNGMSEHFTQETFTEIWLNIYFLILVKMLQDLRIICVKVRHMHMSARISSVSL